MSSYFFAQIPSQPTGDTLQKVFQDVLPSIALLLFIGGTLLLIVVLLRFAARVNALPQANSPSEATTSEATSDEQSGAQLGEQPGEQSGKQQGESFGGSSLSPHIEIAAQNYQSVSVEWTMPLALTHALQRVQGNALIVRLLDVTCIDLSTQPPHAIYDYPCNWGRDETPQVMGIAVVHGDRDYIAELGYMSANRQWHSLALSRHVRVAAMASSS